jgi:hypothetical protein
MSWNLVAAVNCSTAIGCNDLSGIDYWNGYLYVACVNINTSSPYNNTKTGIAVFNSSNLSLVAYHELGPYFLTLGGAQAECSGVGVDHVNGIIYASSYGYSGLIRKFSSADFSFIGYITTNPEFGTSPANIALQDIKYYNGFLYASYSTFGGAGAPTTTGGVIRMDTSGASQTNAIGPITGTTGFEVEGLFVGSGGLHVLTQITNSPSAGYWAGLVYTFTISTTLTLNADTTTPTTGQTVNLTATLDTNGGALLSGQTVAITIYNASGTLVDSASGATNSNGQFTTSYTFTTAGVYNCYSGYTGVSPYTSANATMLQITTETTIVVAGVTATASISANIPTVTALTTSPTAVTLTADTSAPSTAQQVHFTATLTAADGTKSPLQGQSIVISYYDSSNNLLGSSTGNTDGNGHFPSTYTFSTAGQYTCYAAFTASAPYTASVSAGTVVISSAPPATVSKVGSFNTSSGAASNTISGLGFTPTALIMWAGSQSAVGWTANTALCDISFSIGFSANNNGAMEYGSVYNSGEEYVTTTSAEKRGHAASALYLSDYGGTPQLTASSVTFSSSNGGQFVVNWTTHAAAYTVYWLALGGTTGSAVKQWQAQAATGVQSVTLSGTTFKPDIVIHAGIEYATAPPSNTTDQRLWLGAMDSTGNQWAEYMYSANGAATTVEASIQLADHCLVGLNGGTGVGTKYYIMTTVSAGANWVSIYNADSYFSGGQTVEISNSTGTVHEAKIVSGASGNMLMFTTTLANGYNSGDAWVAPLQNNTTAQKSATFSSMNSNGFSVNWDVQTDPGLYYIFSLCLQGGSYTVGTKAKTSQTTAGTDTVVTTS